MSSAASKPDRIRESVNPPAAVIARSVAVLALAAVPLVACGERLELVDWTLPVPEDTPVREYVAVPLAERQGRNITLVDDLVIGARPDDPRYDFSRVRDLAVDEAGRIYVLDGGHSHVHVFDADGGYLRTLGGVGSEPGQLSRPSNIAIAGDKIVVNDLGNDRLSLWGLDGRHIGDHTPADSPFPTTFMQGFGNGYLVAMHSGRTEQARPQIVATYSPEGREVHRFAELPAPEPLRIGRLYALSAMSAVPSAAATAAGDIYLTASAEYQVLALDAGGRARWALNVAWARAGLTDQQKERMLASFRDRVPDLDAEDAVWPEQLPAITNIAVSDNGLLFVFPYVFPIGRPAGEYPVDVYTAEGERVWTGMIERAGWMAARGDFVYSTRWHPETGDTQVVRYFLRVSDLLR